MIPGIRKPPISHQRKAAAIMVAGAADFLQIILWPLFSEGGFSPFETAVDFVTAVILMAICGFKWQFILAFAAELVPGLDLLPTWSAVALLIPSAPQEQSASAPPAPPRYPVIEATAVVIPPVQPRTQQLPEAGSP